MAFQIVLNESQLNDLLAVKSIGANNLSLIADKINSSDPSPIKPSDLQRAIQEILTNSEVKVETTVRVLLSLYNLQRKRNITAEELIDALNYAIETAHKPWPDNEIQDWHNLREGLLKFLSMPAVFRVVKALNLSYNYDNILQSAIILTDIRPVYDDSAKNIEGGVISYNLRLTYINNDRSKSITITMDSEDVASLQGSCERALIKSETAKTFMKEKGKKETFICGEEGP